MTDKKIDPAKGKGYPIAQNPERSRQTYFLTPEDMEHNTGKSETQQDDSLTLQQLLTRYTQGLPLEQKPGHYPSGDQDPDLEDIDLEEFNRLDITEREKIVNDLAAKVERNKRKDKRAEMEAKIEAEKASKKGSEGDQKKE